MDSRFCGSVRRRLSTKRSISEVRCQLKTAILRCAQHDMSARSFSGESLTVTLHSSRRAATESSRIQKQPVDQFQRENLVDLRGVQLLTSF